MGEGVLQGFAAFVFFLCSLNKFVVIKFSNVGVTKRPSGFFG